MKAFDGVAIVTGAARGLGEATARRLAPHAEALVLADVDIDAVSSVADQLGAHAIGFDLADRDSCRSLVAETVSRHGRLDAIVNVAGIDSPPGLAWEITDDHWTRLIDVDLTGQWWCARAALDVMRPQRSGRIVFISSLAARVGSDTDSPAYAAAKAGLIGLTISMARQCEPFGVLVNAITPGTIGSTGTPLTASQRSDYLETYPLGFGGAEPVADAVGYLLGSSGDWISGSVMNVSGGKWRGP